VLTASYDKTARLWEARTGRPLGIPLEHQDAVLAVAFSPDGRTVLTGSRDKTARLWDARTDDAVIEGRPHAPAHGAGSHGNVAAAEDAAEAPRLVVLDNNLGMACLPHETTRGWRDVNVALSSAIRIFIQSLF
jgi:WD40 repeat protein